MLANVGNVDCIFRIVVGIVLLLLPSVTSFGATSALLTWGSFVVGAILVLTAAFKFCPLYRILGMNTYSK